MEGFTSNENGNPIQKENSQDSKQPENGVAESKACPDLHRDLEDVMTEVQMMSDSLVACTQMSKHRALRKTYDAAANAKARQTPQTSNQALPPTERRPERRPDSLDKDVIVSYMMSNKRVKEVEVRNGFLGRDSFTRREREKWGYCNKSSKAAAAAERFWKPSPRAQPEIRETNVEEMIDLTLGELKTLMHLAPSASLLAIALSEKIFKCKGCAKCSKKLSSSLPRILSRIQSLVQYVVVKRKETHRRPDASTGHQQHQSTPDREEEVSNQPKFGNLKEVDVIAAAEATPGVQIVLQVKPEKQKAVTLDTGEAQDVVAKRQGTKSQPDASTGHRQSQSILDREEEVSNQAEFGNLKEVDVITAAEATPGVQIVLQVKPEKQKARIFDTEEVQECFESPKENFAFVRPHESRDVPVVLVIKPGPKPEVLESKKQEISYPKEYSVVFHQKFRFCERVSVSLLVFTSVQRLRLIQNARLTCYLHPAAFKEVQFLRFGKDFRVVFTEKTHRIIKPKPLPRAVAFRSNEKKSFGLSNFLANAPDFVKDLLKEAEEENMEAQKLHEEASGLNDLMQEIHKNQIALSKVLLEKGIYSQSLIKFADPNLMEEESQTLRKISEIQDSPSAGIEHSASSLRTVIQDLRRNCHLKNRMILTLMKGLQSDIPKEWWEETMNYALDSAKPIEEIECQKVSDMIQETSLLLTNEGEESKPPTPLPRSEEQPSEEEPNTKGNVGANTEETDRHSEIISKTTDTSNFGGFLDCRSPHQILAYPVVSVPQDTNNSIRKLEDHISLLNGENKRLWQEVHELRNQLRDSTKELSEKRTLQKEQLTDTPRTSGKAVNLTIQIGAEKIPRHSKEQYPEVGFSGMSRCSPLGWYTDPTKRPVEYSPDRKLALITGRPKFYSKPSERCGRNDLSCLDDTSPTDREKFRGVNAAAPQITAETPYPSSHDDVLKPYKDAIPGPSGRRINFAYLLRRSSPTAANQRGLQPILESTSSSCIPGAVSQALQRLKTRVGSIEREVAVLKLKNDRIDKLLDKLIVDAVDYTSSVDEMKNNLNYLNSRLD